MIKIVHIDEVNDYFDKLDINPYRKGCISNVVYDKQLAFGIAFFQRHPFGFMWQSLSKDLVKKLNEKFYTNGDYLVVYDGSTPPEVNIITKKDVLAFCDKFTSVLFSSDAEKEWWLSVTLFGREEFDCICPVPRETLTPSQYDWYSPDQRKMLREFVRHFWDTQKSSHLVVDWRNT